MAGNVARQPPLGGKAGVAAADHALQGNGTAARRTTSHNIDCHSCVDNNLIPQKSMQNNASFKEGDAFFISCTGHTRVNHSCTLILIILQLLLFRDGILMNSAAVNLCVTQQRSLSQFVSYLEGFISAVGQHVSLQPALTGGRCVVHFATLPQTHKHLADTQTRLVIRDQVERTKNFIKNVILEMPEAKYQIICSYVICSQSGC